LLGVQFQDHVVLVDLGLELVDLALAEGVVQRLVDIGGGQAETRGGAAVDADVGDAAAQLQVVGQVAERRVAAQFFGQALGPGVQVAPSLLLSTYWYWARLGPELRLMSWPARRYRTMPALSSVAGECGR
jgi:hypothetical protein